MDFDLRYPDGLRPVYLGSLRGDQQWYSIGALPDFIPPDVNEHIGIPEAYPERLNSRGLLSGLDQETFAAVYTPRLHWLGWSPISRVYDDGEDLSTIAFNANPVPLQEHYYDVQRAGGSDDSGSPVFAGYYLEERWQNNILFVSRRLHDIVDNLVMKSEYYGHNSWTTQFGDLPGQVQDQDVSGLRYRDYEVQEMASDARRVVLSQMGFVAWYTSACEDWEKNLDDDDLDFIQALKLEERPKRGIVFDLPRDYHEITISHLLKYRVPFHYCWTQAANTSGRFLRYSPDFVREYASLAVAQPEGLLDLTELPSYLNWQEDLARYDVYFQDRFSGRMGSLIREFKPDWEYLIVDFSHYGARPVDNLQAKRAYSERFRATVQRGVTGTICTFFRQNPFEVDEPPAVRVPLVNHYQPLSDFGAESTTEGPSERSYFFEPTPSVRELSKNCNAPRPDRKFNTFSGMRDWAAEAFDGSHERIPSRAGSSRHRTEQRNLGGGGRQGRPIPLQERLTDADLRRAHSPMSPTHRSEGGENNWSSCWVQSMALRRWSSRSMSPFRNESRSLLRQRRRSRTLSSERSSDSEGTGSYRSFQEEYNDVQVGNPELLDEELMATDERESVEIPFSQPLGPTDTYQPRVPTRDEAVQTIKDWAPLITDLKPPTVWTTDEWWNKNVAFIAAGGILSFLAQLYDKELVHRFLEGPSIQVTEYAKGKTCWINNGEEDEVWTADQISEGKISILLGHVVTGNPSSDTFLWPHPAWLEQESDHFHGAWTAGAYSFLKNLEKSIVTNKNYEWRTRKEWQRYIRNGNRGAYVARNSPTSDDFATGMSLIESAFPLDWEKRALTEIEVPEKYEPIALRD
ncbi:hypothetical protein B0H13DRAFT_2390743 [Mycena leptocephala]|nr:hypothetical protein B0H13DRAFT_2390743 [Mycena leptocephala]